MRKCNMIPRSELYDLYHVEELSMRDIADTIGVSSGTVCIWMRKYRIESRTCSESHLTHVSKLSKQELIQLYIKKNCSSHTIGRMVGVGGGTVCNWLNEYNIETRTHHESVCIDTLKPSMEELNQMYEVKELSMLEIAKVIGVSVGTVCLWMKSYSIKARAQSYYNKERSGAWKGGISFEPYCKRFDNKFKESVRVRDDYTCQLCGYEQKLGGQKLDVHHIHYDKENCYPDVVALCRSCNSKVNTDRDYWEQYFEDLLFERGIAERSMIFDDI